MKIMLAVHLCFHLVGYALCNLAVNVSDADTFIAAIGVMASVLSILMVFFLVGVEHALAKVVLVETLADACSSICTTIFSLHTHFDWELDVWVQVALRFTILVPGMLAQVHLVWALLQHRPLEGLE